MSDIHVKFACALHSMATASLTTSCEEVRIGHPCSYLIDRIALFGSYPLAKVLLEELAKEGHFEFALNGAQLTLSIRSNPDGSVWAQVAGAQYESYPNTGPALNCILNIHGFH